MNQNALKNAFIARAKTLAHVMTRSSNVKVTVFGDTAFNVPGHINIPAGDFTDPEWVKMVQGWIDHELGHENHTDDKHYQPFAQKGELHGHLINIIEDVWMEKAVGNRFPGARLNLSTLAEIAVKRNLFKDPSQYKHPLQALSGYLLYGGRSKVIGQKCLDAYATSAFEQVVNHFGQDFADKLSLLVDEVHSVESTAAAVTVASKVVDMLRQEQQQQQQQQQQSDDADADSDDNQPGDSNDDAEADSDDNQPGDSNDDAEADSDDNQPGDSDDDADADSDDNQPGDSDDDADADSDDNQPGDSDDDAEAEDKPTPQQIIAAIEKALNEASDAELEDFHEALAKVLGLDAEEAQDDEELSVITTLMKLDSVSGYKSDYLSSNSLLDQVTARRLSGSVYQTMHKVLFDQAQSLEITRKVGSRLLNRKLAGIPAGNLSVFSRRAEMQDVSAAISVVIDASGSMNVDREIDGKEVTPILYANACAYAFALGLDKAGVSSEFVYYGQNDGTSYTMYTAKTYDEKPIASRFSVKATGQSTPSSQAITYALNSLALRPENKKFMIFLTDGEPDDPIAVTHATQLASMFGVKIIPIGICTNVVHGFQKDDFVVVNDPSQLTTALREAVKLKLFN